MKGNHQLAREIAIGAPPDQVWAVVADSNLLPDCPSRSPRFSLCSLPGPVVKPQTSDPGVALW